MLRGVFRSSSMLFKAGSYSQRSFHRTGLKKNFDDGSIPPVNKPPSRLWKVFKYSAILAATGATLFLVASTSSLFVTVLSRKYVTQEDMHEYRSMARNMLVDHTVDEVEEELLKCAIIVDEQTNKLMVKREPSVSEGIRQRYSQEALDQTINLVKIVVLGNEKERRRAWNDHYSFYYTYIELDELQRLRENGYEWGMK